MHKIDGAGHLNNMFVWEDPLLNRPPTEITAEWLNAVQIELATVIEWAGFALNKSSNGQLLQSLQAKFASLAPEGDYAVKLAVQGDNYKAAVADVVGAPDAIVAEFVPDIASLVAAHGMTLYVRALAANATTTPTFTPNNGTIAHKTIVKGNNLPLVAGDIAGAGFWLELRYDLTLDKWVLMNPATGVVPLVDQVPVGTVSYFSSATAPSGWLKANGAAISRTAYATLFSAIGVTFGAGDGASTFGLPDLRGEFIRGFDDARGIDAGRSLGSAQGDAIRNITGSVGSLVIGSRNSFTGGSGAFATSNFNNGAADSQAGSYGGATSFSFDASRQVPTAHEARPRNIALLACIKY